MSDTKTTRETGWEAVAINDELEKTGLTFQVSGSEVLKGYGREILFGEDNMPYSKYDGEILPLSDAILRWSMDERNANVVDLRSLPRTGAPGRPGIASKADLKTLSQKVAFIAEHGEDAFSRLPLTSGLTKEVETRADWFKLSRAEKVRRTALDPDAFEKLPPAPLPGRHNQSFANTAALDKIADLRSKAGRR